MTKYDVNKTISTADKAIDNFRFRVIINPGSGTISLEQIQYQLTLHPTQLVVHDVHVLGRSESNAVQHSNQVIASNSCDIATQMQILIQQASDMKLAVLIAGGDGTLCLGVQYALQYQVPLAILALGTFNLLARHHGFSLVLEEQIAQLTQCRLSQVPICFANEQPFTSSASFGLYPEVIRDRERYQRQFGLRHPATGYFAGLVTFFKPRSNSRFKIITHNRQTNIECLLMIVTQNKPQLELLGFDHSIELAGQFAVVRINPQHWFDKLRLLIKGGLQSLYKDAAVKVDFLQHMVLEYEGEQVQCVLDGEVKKLQSPIRFSVDTQALQLFVPPAQDVS